ncbi:hypothetical protein ACTQ50_14610 [Blautia sp. Sow4_E7]|uniref:hypothetical protein n=1 Tax=Blautia sp. Sow4_E7 TaxID=3438749 RepID=UPI003F92FF67
MTKKKNDRQDTSQAVKNETNIDTSVPYEPWKKEDIEKTFNKMIQATDKPNISLHSQCNMSDGKRKEKKTKIKIELNGEDIQHLSFMLDQLKSVYCEMLKEEFDRLHGEEVPANYFFECLDKTIVVMQRIYATFYNKNAREDSNGKYKYYKPCKDRNPYEAWTKQKKGTTSAK